MTPLMQQPARNSKESHSARVRFLQSDNFPHQRGLAATVSAGNGEHFSSMHRQTYVPVHDGVTKSGEHMTHLNDRRLDTDVRARHDYNSHQLSRILHHASNTITKKILSTTLIVVCRPTSSTPPRI